LIVKQIKDFYQNANRLSGGRLDILKNALTTFSKTRASQASASLAYYAIFSLFPLLLVLIAGGSYFLNSRQVYQSVTRLVQNAIPVSPQLINENLQQVLSVRGAVGIIGLLTLLWSASGFFTSLAYNINLAWPDAPRRNFLEKRLIGLGMIAGLSGLLILSLALDWTTSLIPFLNADTASLPSLGLWRLISNLASWLTIFLLFLALYRWVPATHVHWSASFWSALITSIAWKAATTGFNWYLQSGLGRYQLVYGSLGAIVALLFLIFIVSMITLFGAHLCAAIDRWKNEQVVEL
jgi:membrane protein